MVKQMTPRCTLPWRENEGRTEVRGVEILELLRTGKAEIETVVYKERRLQSEGGTCNLRISGVDLSWMQTGLQVDVGVWTVPVKFWELMEHLEGDLDLEVAVFCECRRLSVKLRWQGASHMQNKSSPIPGPAEV